VAGSVNTNSKDKTLKKCCSIVSNYGLQDNDTETALVDDIVTTANFVAGKQ
jgi:predicted component of type VI protein secretion system